LRASTWRAKRQASDTINFYGNEHVRNLADGRGHGSYRQRRDAPQGNRTGIRPNASRTYSLQRLQQALQAEQEAAQQEGSNPLRIATAEALANEIKRIGSLSRGASQRPQQGGGGGRPQQQQPRNFRQDQQRRPKSRGRRPMGRPTGR
jgi:hypothetical protein